MANEYEMTDEKAIRLLETKKRQPSTDWQMAEAYDVAIRAIKNNVECLSSVTPKSG